MSWSRPLVHKAFLAAALAVLLAGCSGLRPLYGESGVAPGNLAFAYSEPTTRADQIIIQALRLRLGKSASPDAPLVTIASVAGSRQLNRSAAPGPVSEYEAVVTATYSVEEAGEVYATGTRAATARYTTNGQVLADDAAYNDAIERAAREVAQTIRLAILGALATPAS